MAMNERACIHIREMSDVVEARQKAMTICEAHGFTGTQSGNIAAIVTELATNLVNHAGEGDILLRLYTDAEVSGIECLALDRGKGIKDIGRSLKDADPAGTGQGNGLTSVRRLSSFFDLYSQPEKGTAVLSRIAKEPSAHESDPQHPRYTSRIENGVVCLPLQPGEPCGDGWEIIRLPGRTVILVVDGLGHGLEASKVQEEAIRIFRKNPAREPVEILRILHAALTGTRGGAVAVAVIDETKGMVTFAGAGNISGRIITGPDSRGMVSLNGTAGIEIRKFLEDSHSWESESLLILHSDGLTMQWDLENYPGLQRKHPALIAGVLFRDHRRGGDDVTVLAVKQVEMNV